ncbi:SET domain-containing protein [Aureococcus anophagefferens]|nr:SET domain-containing protein [Aureococcus anophagefferens]
MADGDGRSSPAAKPNFKPTSTRCVTRLETSVRDSAYASSERRRPALAGVWESLDKARLALTVTVNGRGAATPGAPAPTAEKVAAFARRTRDAMEARRRGGAGVVAESDATDAFLRARPAGDGDASDFAAAPWPAGRFALERHVPIPSPAGAGAKAASALGFAPPGVFDGAADDVAEDVAAAPEPQLETGSPSPKKGAKRKRYQTGSNGLSLTLGKRKAKKIPAHSRWATAHAALFRRQKLALGSRASRAGGHAAFMPCNHDGPCDTGACSCVARGAAFCEVLRLRADCRARFPGCRCAPNLDPERQGCRAAGACDCVAAGRECDPDLCRCCSSAPVSGDPTAVDDIAARCAGCRNVAIRLRRHKRVAIGRSCTHGWGAFALERCRVGDLVGEYRGELVSQDEADRRGKIYDKLNCSFLFNLDDELVVGARKGAKMKFANHHADPNCAARVALVDGDHRIGLFAKREIAPGEELDFNDSAGFWESTQIESSAPTPDA